MRINEEPENPMQVALVRLRLEGIQFKLLHRHEFDTWPFSDETIAVLVRATASPIQDSPGVVLATVGPLYIMADGVERPLTTMPGFEPFYNIAMAMSGMWMSSGWSG